jgi:signal transduction histidine kinase
VLAIQFVGALLIQAGVSGLVREEVALQMVGGMETSGALHDCVTRPGPWENPRGMWTAWPVTADGLVVGTRAPADAVSLPAEGALATWSGSRSGLVYASASEGCGGLLLIDNESFPLFESRSETLSLFFGLRVVLVILVGIALVGLTAVPLARRIRRLSEAMREVVADGFEGTVADGANDELGDVASAFDAATETARERMEQLEFRDRVVRHALADFAHDARTPLATLKLAASSLERSKSSTLIRAELDFLEGMTRNLEALLEGSSSHSSETLQVDRLVERVELRFAPLARDRGLEFETALPDLPLYVDAESIGLERAVSNIVQNAVRFAASRIALLVFEDGDEIRIEVRDDGPGLGELSRRASERGTRGPQSNAEGSGLGLAIAEASVRRFGGRLETGDSEGGGALVAIVLPSVQPDATTDA